MNMMQQIGGQNANKNKVGNTGQLDNNGLFQNIDISNERLYEEELKSEKFDPNRILVESDAWPEE
jgi:hypothetical protein